MSLRKEEHWAKRIGVRNWVRLLRQNVKAATGHSYKLWRMVDLHAAMVAYDPTLADISFHVLGATLTSEGLRKVRTGQPLMLDEVLQTRLWAVGLVDSEVLTSGAIAARYYNEERAK